MKFKVIELEDEFAIEATNLLTGEKDILVGRYATEQDAIAECNELNRDNQDISFPNI